MLKWLEVSGDFECNNRCLGCFSVASGGRQMSTVEFIENLRVGRASGASWLWIGGGEPTLRRDLFTVAAFARKLGYSRVKLQTNGMMLAYPDYARRCVDAGITEVNFAIKGATAASHDRLTATPGCFDLLVKAIEAWARTGLHLDGDVLVYRSVMHELPDLVRFFTARGVERYNLWLFSNAVQSATDLSGEVPRIADVMPFIGEALALGLSTRTDFITSLHTPPCTVPPALSRALFLAADLDLLVANPGGYRFRLEASPIEGGQYLERCAGCALRGRCGGLRQEYLKLFGDEEFAPVADGASRARPVLRDVDGFAAAEAARTGP